MKISWWGCFSILMGLWLASGAAHAGDLRARGDDDAIPWACVDFTGNWTAESGKLVQIEQRRCNWLKLKGTMGLQDNATVIVPDDKVRTIAEDKYRGAVRYRWNSNEYGSILENVKVICYNNRTVEEYVTLEWVNDHLLLETTYRTTTYFQGDGKPRRDVKQQQLRRKGRY